MCPLLKMWSHPSVLEPIKDAMVIFQPDITLTLLINLVEQKFNLADGTQIIPDLFKYASYPVTALIDLFWKKYNRQLCTGSVIDPCMIEVVSMLEHTLNYAHTGNAAVLCKKLMDRSWLSLGLLADGFPALSDAFIALGALSMEQLVVQSDSWPVDSQACCPLTSSKRSQQLTYGKAHYEVSPVTFLLCKTTACAKCTKWLLVQNAQNDSMSTHPLAASQSCYARN